MITDNEKIEGNHPHAQAARRLLREHRYGVLCTLSKKFEGHPFGSIVPYLVDHDGSLLILISALAEHTKNIQQDGRVSLITHSQDDPHIQMQGRVTVVGRAMLEEDRALAGRRYLRYFPEAKTYFSMGDFQFYRIVPQTMRYIGGLGNIHWVKEGQCTVARCALVEQEEELIAQINLQHEQEIRRYTGQDQCPVALIGVDSEGFDLRAGERIFRIHTELPLSNAPQALQQILTAV